MSDQDRCIDFGFGHMIAIHIPPKHAALIRERNNKLCNSVSNNSWLCLKVKDNEGFIPQLLNHSKFPVGPSILQTQPCALPCDERGSSMDKIDNPKVNSDTP